MTRTCLIHWISFTTEQPLPDLLAYLAHQLYEMQQIDDKVAAGMFTEIPSGLLGYERQHIGYGGVRVLWSPGREDIHVSIPGAACENCLQSRLLQLFRDTNPFRFTRVDLALDGAEDEHGNPISPKDLYEMCKNKPEMVKTWVQFNKLKPDGQPVCNLQYHENARGQTCDIGSRSSERFMRIYDQRGVTRLELEIKGDRAEKMQEILSERTLDDLPDVVIGLLRDFIEFIEPASNKNKSRAKLQGWWERVVEFVEPIVVRIVRPVAALDRSFYYFKSNLSATLATLQDAHGGAVDFIDQLLATGHAKQGPKHRAMLQTAGGWGAWADR